MRLNALWPWRRRSATTAVGVAVVMALIVGFAAVSLRPGGGAATSQHSAVIQPGPFAVTLGLVGVVAPGAAVAVVAPFDGKVTQVGFEFGGRVIQGQALVTLDTSDIQQRRDEAEAEFLKAAQAASALDGWATGPEVSQARRSAAAAALDLADTTRKIAETKVLLDRGLVARDELDGLIQQRRGQESALAAAHQELAETLKRGVGSNRRVTDIELSIAKAHLDELRTQLAGAIVRAPVAGVIVRPQNDKIDSSAATLHAGAALSRGQLIGAIAKPDGLAVTFQLSEVDANRVLPGQHVEVSGPGFEGLAMQGAVASVAHEATPASGGAGAVTFLASAQLDNLTAAQAAVIRIGMTANVTIDLYRNPSALTAPPDAIQGTAPDTFVMVKNASTGATRRVAVRIGQVAPDGVEILSGLKAGDVVVWSGGGSGTSDADAS